MLLVWKLKCKTLWKQPLLRKRNCRCYKQVLLVTKLQENEIYQAKKSRIRKPWKLSEVPAVDVFSDPGTKSNNSSTDWPKQPTQWGPD
jgi:hypothetical protein